MLVGALFALPACSGDADQTACSTDAHCGGGEACDLESGRCMASLDTSTFNLEVSPPSNNQGWVRQEFVSGQHDLQLDEAVSLQGIVHASDDDTPLAARVRVWRDSLIEGRPSVLFETTTAGVDTNHEGYVLWLTRNQTYSLFVTPQPPADTMLPPALEGGLKLEDHGKKDVVLDGADRAVEVVGKVVDAAGKPLPFAVQVRAYHEGGWLRSTAGQTCGSADKASCACTDDSCYGDFSLRIPYGVRSYTVRVEPAIATEIDGGNIQKSAVPTMECSKAVLGLVSPKNGETPRMQLTEALRLPPFPLAQEYKLTVLGSDDLPLPGAQVTFETPLEVPHEAGIFKGGCAATFRRTATTDDTGTVTLALLPGDSKNRIYQLTVISSPQGPHASKYIPSYELGPSGGTLAPLRLDRRHELRGQVVDYLDRPLAGTRVEAQGLVVSTTSAGLPPSSVSVSADAQGAFVLYVDPGVYHVHCSPAADSGAPRFSWLAKEVRSSIDGLRFKAPEPTLLSGGVLLPAIKERLIPEGAGGFTVNAYESLPQPDASITSVLRATAISDASGTYRLVLPRR